MFFDSYDTPVFRPPSEARSFILRVTRGCAHNKCTYCNMYRGVPFQVLTEEEVAIQIEAAAVHGRNSVRRVFLADGDALVLSTPRLLKILDALYKTFPKLQRVAAYSAPKDILRKSHEELVELREAGLKLLYYGMETGDDITLQAVKKGVSGEEAVEAGRKVIAAGMKLSMMIILGLAGKPGSKRHAAETAKAINAIKPTMLSALCLMLYRGSELLDQFERGEFEPLPPQGLMEELYSILAAVELPEAVKAVFIFADRDKSQTGQNAAIKLRDRLLESGIPSVICLPSPDMLVLNEKGVDWNDVIRLRGPSAFPFYRELTCESF